MMKAISMDGTDPATWDPALDGVFAAPENHSVLYEDDAIRGVDPVWWTPLKLIFEVSDAPLPNRLSAGVPATDGRSGAIWTHARGVGA